jgi:hypothetical protein
MKREGDIKREREREREIGMPEARSRRVDYDFHYAKEPDSVKACVWSAWLNFGFIILAMDSLVSAAENNYSMVVASFFYSARRQLFRLYAAVCMATRAFCSRIIEFEVYR